MNTTSADYAEAYAEAYVKALAVIRKSNVDSHDAHFAALEAMRLAYRAMRLEHSERVVA